MEHFATVERLHTDALEEQYGHISAQVVRHDLVLREAHLIDLQGISRTYAITFFPEEGVPALLQHIDEHIRLGEAIGKAFRKQGFAIRKNVLDVFIIALPRWLQLAFATQEQYAKVRISEFYAKEASEEPLIYGTVVEVYSPEFRPPLILPYDIQQVNAVSKVLEEQGIDTKTIWNELGNQNQYRGKQDIVTQARITSLPHIFSLRTRLMQYLEGKTIN